MTRLLSDSFTESADKALASHTPETGGAWTIYSSATMTVLASEGRARGSDATVTAIYYNAGAQAANVSVAATVRRTTTSATEGSPGVVARLQPASDSRYLAIHIGGQLMLQKRVSGTTTTIASASPAFPVDTDCTLELRVNGSELIVLWNGAVAISTSDAALPGAGYAGIACRLNGRVDSVTADTIAWSLAPAKGAHATGSDATALGVGYGLAPTKAAHPASSGAAPLGVAYDLAVAKGVLPGSADPAQIAVAYALVSADAASSQRAGASALTVGYALAPDDAAQPVASACAALTWIAPLAPERAVLMVIGDAAALRRALAPPSAGISDAVAADRRGLRIEQDFRTEEIEHG